MKMTDVEQVLLVQRVRRNFPRHSDILAVCELAERSITAPKQVEAERMRAPKGSFDKRTYQRLYQREWMRRKRARNRLGSG